MNALPEAITDHADELRALCEKYHVRKLALFGSAAKGTFDPDRSDLDFLVAFERNASRGGLRGPYFGLLSDLQELFGREVDLVEATRIENPYFRQVLELTQQPLYESDTAA